MEQLINKKKVNRQFVQSLHYGNILLKDPQGTPMCTIGVDRAEWYLKKKLAIEDFGRKEKKIGYRNAIRLEFKPKAVHTGDYHTQIREDKCCICGAKEEISLHHVIPKAIRKHFPKKEKSKQAAWCVLLCDFHHDLADEKAAKIYQKEMIEEIKKENMIKTKEEEDVKSLLPLWTLIKIKNLKIENKIPKARLETLLKAAEVKNLKDLTSEDIEKVGELIKDSAKKKKWDLRKRIRVRQMKWAKKFIREVGGIKELKEIFKTAFLSLEPKHLFIGALEDHK